MNAWLQSGSVADQNQWAERKTVDVDVTQVCDPVLRPTQHCGQDTASFVLAPRGFERDDSFLLIVLRPAAMRAQDGAQQIAGLGSVCHLQSCSDSLAPRGKSEVAGGFKNVMKMVATVTAIVL